jgi:hypothetical protein
VKQDKIDPPAPLSRNGEADPRFAPIGVRLKKASDEEVAEAKEELDGLVKEPEVVKEPGNGMSEKIGEDPLRNEALTLQFGGRSMSEIFWLQQS